MPIQQEFRHFGKSVVQVCQLTRRGCLDVCGLQFALNMTRCVSPGPNSVLLRASDELGVIQAAALLV